MGKKLEANYQHASWNQANHHSRLLSQGSVFFYIPRSYAGFSISHKNIFAVLSHDTPIIFPTLLMWYSHHIPHISIIFLSYSHEIPIIFPWDPPVLLHGCAAALRDWPPPLWDPRASARPRLWGPEIAQAVEVHMHIHIHIHIYIQLRIHIRLYI